MRKKANTFLFFSILIGIYMIYAIASVFNKWGKYKSIADFIVVFIMLGLVIILEIFLLTKFKYYSNPERLKQEKEQIEKIQKEKYEKEKLIPGSNARIESLEANLCIKAKHVSGLPVAEDAEMYLYLCDDKMIFERNENRYNLEFSKLRDVTIKTDEEIQKAYVSSVGGAIAGQMLFGTLGAMVGGRAKEKTTKTITSYLIFTYDKDGTNEFISFDVTNIPNAINFVTHFSENHSSEKREINL